MDSIKEQLITAITAAVGGTASTPSPDDELDLPQTSVSDAGEEAERDIYGYTTVKMTVEISTAQRAVSSDPEEMRSQCNEMLAQLITTMFADETFGGLADDLFYTAGGISTEARVFSFALARFTVVYHFVHGNPYQKD